MARACVAHIHVFHIARYPDGKWERTGEIAKKGEEQRWNDIHAQSRLRIAGGSKPSDTNITVPSPPIKNTDGAPNRSVAQPAKAKPIGNKTNEPNASMEYKRPNNSPGTIS